MKARKANCNAPRTQFAMKLVLLSLFCLSQALASKDLMTQAADNKTCVLSQLCEKNDCSTPAVFHPVLDIRAPEPVPITGFQTLADMCPMYGTYGTPVCCSANQTHIMKGNFNSIDSVFGKESGTCGVNLKILWCHYTCDPKQNDFIGYGGI